MQLPRDLPATLSRPPLASVALCALTAILLVTTTLSSCVWSESDYDGTASETSTMTGSESDRGTDAGTPGESSRHDLSSDNGYVDDGVRERAVRAAVEHLAADQGVGPDQVTVVAVEAVEWPDSGLGCPQPDMLYMQVITPGFRIVLEADGVEAQYHTDRADPTHVIRCDSARGVVAP